MTKRKSKNTIDNPWIKSETKYEFKMSRDIDLQNTLIGRVLPIIQARDSLGLWRRSESVYETIATMCSRRYYPWMRRDRDTSILYLCWLFERIDRSETG